MTIDRWISDAAKRHPEKTALEFEGTRLSYSALDAQVTARAKDLLARNVGQGDRIAWYGLNAPEVFVLLFAAARIGAMLVPLNWRLAEEEVAAIVKSADPKVLFYDDTFKDAAHRLSGVSLAPSDAFCCASDEGESAEGAPTEDAALLLVYTSGSTGAPKGVVLTQSALVANAKMSIEAHAMTASDVVLNVLPLFHVGGLNILPTPAFSLGATVLLHRSFDPSRALSDLSRSTLAITVPTVLQALMEQPDWATADLSALRAISVGSTDVPRAQIDALHRRDIPAVQIYGATETCPLAIYQTTATAIDTAGSIGRAGCACDIRLVGPDGQDVPDGTPGEIWVRGDNTLRGYWRDAEETARALQDGWFRTGDVASRDASGLYWFADRIKHVIISGGENIYPAEVERVLRTHPGIREVAVVGQPDPTWGETPVAVVVARDANLTGDQVLASLKGRLARYKHPRRVVFLDALPRNAMGKVVAAKLRALVADLPEG